MSNRSINVFTDTISADEVLAQLKPLVEAGLADDVIINGGETKDVLSERPVHMFTFLNCTKEQYTKIRNRKAVRALKGSGNIKNFGYTG